MNAKSEFGRIFARDGFYIKGRFTSGNTFQIDSMNDMRANSAWSYTTVRKIAGIY